MKKFLILFFVLLTTTAYSIDIPNHTGYVTDKDNILKNVTKSILITHIEKLKAKNDCELAVLVTKSMNGLEIEEYANEVFNKWGIGNKEYDNGLLIVLAIKERKARIEVGYGLEGILTDSMTGQLLLEHAVPYFKKNEWDNGLIALTKSITKYLITFYVKEESLSEVPIEHKDKVYIESKTNKYIYMLADYFVIISIIIAILFFIVNIVLSFLKKFLAIWLFIIEILFAISVVIGSFKFDVDEFSIISLIAVVCYMIQLTLSRKHKCPKCKHYMTIKRTTIRSATYSSSGKARIDYNCKNCGYHNSKNIIIPKRTRTKTSSSSSWSSSSSSSWSSSSSSSWSSSSSSSSFGGGSSGGGGSSVSF